MSLLRWAHCSGLFGDPIGTQIAFRARSKMFGKTKFDAGDNIDCEINVDI